MLLQTKHFGELEVSEDSVLIFEEGLPGFEDVHKFTLFCSEDSTSPFRWLLCIDEPDLAFAVVDPFLIKKDYDINLKDDVLESLGIEKPEDVLVYSIVVVPEDVTKISMNLKAPVIINSRSNKGMQVILDTDKYGVRHYILDELRRQEVGENACSDQEKGTVDCNK